MSKPIIRAAGCLVTRDTTNGLEVLVVHRPRYDDWSLPKGKLDPGEHPLLAAVREVREETGVVVALRRPLPQRHYEVDGAPKVVDYWRAVALAESEFEPNDEVDELRWLSVDEAAATMTHSDDADMALTATEPTGTPFVVLRHGSAVKRVDWSGVDVDRPLDPEGTAQADALVQHLASYGALRVYSSAARRCVDTVRPYALTAGMPLVAEPALTEEGYHAEPEEAFDRAGGLLADTWRSGDAAVLCGHRPYLPQLVEHLVGLSPRSPGATPWALPLPETVPTASLTVLHVHQGEPGGRPTTLAVEHHGHL